MPISINEWKRRRKEQGKNYHVPEGSPGHDELLAAIQAGEVVPGIMKNEEQLKADVGSIRFSANEQLRKMQRAAEVALDACWSVYEGAKAEVQRLRKRIIELEKTVAKEKPHDPR